MKGCKPLISIILFFINCSVYAQQNHIRFDRITINDGLSLSSVYTIFQDSKGFMWFGTEDGLNKYDGQHFQVYRPQIGNVNSLSYRWTELIFEDSKGQLWFGSKGGLTLFNPVFETFQRYGSTFKNNRLVGDTITSIIEQQGKQLWVGTVSGINLINLETGEVELEQLKGHQIITLAIIDQKLWVGTHDGLYVESVSHKLVKQQIEDQGSGNFIIHSIIDDGKQIWIGAGSNLLKATSANNHDPIIIEKINFETSHNTGQVEQLQIDDQNNIWLSCSHGLYVYDVERNVLSEIITSIDLSHSLAINATKPLHLDKFGNIWYGTHGDGVYIIDTQNRQYTNFRNNPGELTSLSENTINCIFEDRSENIWIGTFGAGISIYRPDAHKFGFISHQPFKENTLSSNFVWSIMECEDEKVWIGTDDAGLNIYDPVHDHFTNYIYRPGDPNSISHSSVRKVYQDSKKRIWIGTDGGGLNQFYPATGKFTSFKNIPSDTLSISGNSVRVIYEDLHGNLWVGTRSGLNLFDPATGLFKRFVNDESDESSISNNFVYSSIYHDEKNNLWVGTYGGGLNMLDIESGKFKRFLHDPADLHSISDNIVFSIHEESSGILWIGTNSGLNRFVAATGKFERFGLANGLPNEVIYGILEDNTNHLWLSTNRGICRFSLIDYTTKNFGVNDGLQSKEFNGGAFHKGKSGRMYFGGVYGLNVIDPEFSYINDNKSQTTITSFEVLGNKVITSFDSARAIEENRIIKKDDVYSLPSNISYTEEIYLDYKHRFFSIEFVALNSFNDVNLTFQYIMEGLDQDWNDAGNRNFVSYANMQPGEYLFKVRTVNLDGFAGISDASLKIFIDSPFWKTWWFYLLELAIIIIILVFVYKYLLKIRTNKLLRIQNEKVFQANQKLSESEKNLKELNATKDKFFSIISHDIKNPFTSLLSISELMSTDYESMDDEEKEQGIKRVHDSGKRIYKLLENLLTWSRAQSGRVVFKPLHLNLEEVAKENLQLMEETASKKGIKLTFDIPDVAIAYCDKDMVETILRNLLINAIKFSHEGQTVELKIKDITTSYEIAVVDHGIGMSEEEREKVFRIDAKLKKEGTSGEKGTGLGLIICKEFVERNRGTISISSTPGKGCTFIFTLPKTGSFVE